MSTLKDDVTDREWHIDWEGKFSLLSVFIPIPAEEYERVVGLRYPAFLVLYKRGYSRGLFDANEYAEAGRVLTERFSDVAALSAWCSAFRAAGDAANAMLSLPAASMLDQLDSFISAHRDYTVYQQGTKLAYNYAAAYKQEERILRELEEARKYSETFFKLSTEALDRLASYIVEKNPSYLVSQITSLTDKELSIFASSGVLPDASRLEERDSGCGAYWGNWREKGIRFLSGEEVETLESAWKTKSVAGEVTGQTAYDGNARGRCRVILDYKGADLEEGEVLVTGMTDPNFLALMKKASAIVTDGGGLLCHAAIVARELKKPCIIGTKIATKTFKDGDMIEVDADAGIVRKI